MTADRARAPARRIAAAAGRRARAEQAHRDDDAAGDTPASSLLDAQHGGRRPARQCWLSGEPVRAGAAGQERGDDALHLLALEQERVVAVARLDLVVAHVLVRRAQGAGDLLELIGRMQPVAAEGHARGSAK